MEFRLRLVKRIGRIGVHDRLLEKIQAGVGDPLAVTKQFYQLNSRRGEQTAVHRVGQLDQLVTPWEIRHMSVGGMNELPGLRNRHVEVERDATEAADQLDKDHELLLYVRVCLRTNRIEDAHQIGFLIGKTEVAVTQVKSLGKRNDRRQLISSLPLDWNVRVIVKVRENTSSRWTRRKTEPEIKHRRGGDGGRRGKDYSAFKNSTKLRTSSSDKWSG